MMNKETSAHKSKEKLHHKQHAAKEPTFTDEEFEFSSADGDVDVEIEEYAAHKSSAGCGCGCGSHNAHY